ncbi:MAG: type IV toxin-antitoxin system AbiEi family antitoxin [Desulfovibrio sp.]|jgi:hypothetical protein|nr:type IV toxin-antitoxin system AbiEi family antitoxin [Desulfovibrio sp.]
MTNGNLARHLDHLRSSGPPFFTDRSVSEALGQPPKVFLGDIVDLVNAGDAVCPQPGFYILAEEGITGLDADPRKWVHAYMGFLGIRYRMSHLCAAADFYGASHQAIMSTHIVVPQDIPDICTKYAKIFFLRQHPRMFAKVNRDPWLAHRKNGLIVASPELTLFDLVDFARSRSSETWLIGQITKDMGELVKPDRLKELAKCFPACIVRRLGYFLDLAELPPQADALRGFLSPKMRYIRLNPRVLEIPKLHPKYNVDERWKIIINDEIEYDI